MYDINKTVKEVLENIDRMDKIKNCKPAEHNKTIKKEERKQNERN